MESILGNHHNRNKCKKKQSQYDLLFETWQDVKRRAITNTNSFFIHYYFILLLDNFYNHKTQPLQVVICENLFC